MQISYNGKQDISEIYQKAKEACNSHNVEIPENISLLFKGENFDALSILQNTHRGKIDLVYIDPPFNTSQNFYFADTRSNTISSSKNSTIAYYDKMSKDEYLEFIRQRLILIKELMSEKGSIYLHIDCKIGHYVKIIMDEVFGESNFKNDITRIKSNPKNFHRTAYGNEKDLILFYAKDSKKNIWNDIRIPLTDEEISEKFDKQDEDGRFYTTIPLHAPGETKSGITGMPWRGIPVPEGRHWRTDPAEFDKLDEQGHIEWSSSGNPRIKKYADEHKGKKIQDIWKFKDPQNPKYPTEKNSKMLDQIIMQSSNEGSIILDCFAGSGTTLRSAHSLGRMWIGVDSSDRAIEVIQNNKLGCYRFYNLDTGTCDIFMN